MLGVLALLSGTVVFGQTTKTLRVTVPFDFIVAGQKMPAGEYQIDESDHDGTMIIHSVATKQSAIVLGEPSSMRTSDHPPSVNFETHNGVVHLVRVSDASGPARVLRVHEQ